MPQYKAFIGTRELDVVSRDIIQLYLRAVDAAVKSRHDIITGAAPGADQLAALTALKIGGYVKLVLPWKNYEKRWVDLMCSSYLGKVDIEVYNPVAPKHATWTESITRHHPAGRSLSAGALMLHGRNYGIVCDVSTVIAIPNPTKPGGGGTGQGIRIAQAKGIQLFDLTKPDHFADLTKRLDRAGK